jgi:chromate transporter
MGPLGDLATVFSQLGLAAVGGGIAVLPEMHRQVVEVHHWMNDGEFASLYALAQAAPGPNMLVTTLIGWRVAGLAGAMTATFSMVGPPALLAFSVSSLWQRFRERTWRKEVQAGITPVVAGLIAAAAVLLSITTSTSAGAALVTLGGAAALILTRLNPLWVLGAGALLGLLGLI